ncbi:Cytochrome P450 4C1 [Araneus ventricosus]|uniref:Cytochrome P450 4C1 n=1 Tax=Araneus ventricosus TaxID=182803 RepID=A0A4Y2I9X3_ARAVE|nr:Cytochrome P450 4C1 [Araneus ventricosus]
MCVLKRSGVLEVVIRREIIVLLFSAIQEGLESICIEHKAVLSSSTMIAKSVYYNFFHSWLGTGLFTSSGEKWRKHRKLLTPTFHFSILENFIPVFQEQSSVLVSKLQALTQESWVDIVPLANLCTLDIICQAAMGVKINAQRNENKEYAQAVHGITGAIINRIFRPWLYFDIIYYLTPEGKKYRSNLQRAHEFTGKIIKEKMAKMLERATLKQEETTQDEECRVAKRKPFLEFLLEYHFKDPSFTEEFIREEVNTFMFAQVQSNPISENKKQPYVSTALTSTIMTETVDESPDALNATNPMKLEIARLKQR